MVQYKKLSGKKGYTTYQFNGKYIYSNYDPVTEAKRYIASLGKIKPVVITCCGLDYVNDELSKLDEVRLIISFEPVDFENASGKKKIIRVKTCGRIEDVLLAENIHANDISLIFWKELLETDPTVFIEPLKRIGEIIRKSSFSSNTAKAFGFLESKNVLMNLACNDIFHYIDNSSVNAEAPAVVISPGASLYDSLDFIKSTRNNAVLFALPSSLPFLGRNDIYPDYAIAVDPGYATFYHLAKYKNNIRLILPLTANMNVFQLANYEINLFSYDNYFENIFFENTGIINSPPEGTVFINLLRVIKKLGFHDTVIIGQDFAFKDGITHVKGGFFENEIMTSAGFFKTFESSIKKIEGAGEKTEININGKSFPTSAAFKLYFEHFIGMDFGLNLFLPEKYYNPLSDNIKKIDAAFIKDNYKIINGKDRLKPYHSISDAAGRKKNIKTVARGIYKALKDKKTSGEIETILKKTSMDKIDKNHLDKIKKIIDAI